MSKVPPSTPIVPALKAISSVALNVFELGIMKTVPRSMPLVGADVELEGVSKVVPKSQGKTTTVGLTATRT